MAERQLVHVTKIPDFMAYLFHKHDAEIMKPLEGEVFRVSVSGAEVGFSRREGAKHLTTWGVGTKLAEQYVKIARELKHK